MSSFVYFGEWTSATSRGPRRVWWFTESGTDVHVVTNPPWLQKLAEGACCIRCAHTGSLQPVLPDWSQA
jgi:hypothetical protein